MTSDELVGRVGAPLHVFKPTLVEILCSFDNFIKVVGVNV